jgi:arylsulfatase A-like enzyme
VPPAVAAGAAGGARPNLIVYLVDTLRADHLGCYGYALPTSPRIDRFAGEATLFLNGRAQSSWTKPAIASVLTGLFPVAHGAELRPQRIHESVETLAERLQASGYETALFTTNANITARFGFAQGWDTFRSLKHRKGRKHEHYDAAEMNVEIFAWLAERERRHPDRPLLLFVHTLDPHDPYRPREEYRRRFAAQVDLEAACCLRSNELAALTGAAAVRQAAAAMALYDAEIAQNDAAFGDFLDELARRGLAGSSAVLLTADHGEEFFDHGGWKHGFTLYEEMLRIPFVLRLPGGVAAGRTIAAPVDQVDIAPTLLALAGLPPSSELPGRDLRPLLADPAGLPPLLPTHPSFAWLARPGGRWVSAVGGPWKLIRQSSAEPLLRPGRELYELVGDPRERTSLLDPARRPPARVRWLEGGLAAALARFGAREAAEETEIDPELDRSLRALGYI